MEAEALVGIVVTLTVINISVVSLAVRALRSESRSEPAVKVNDKQGNPVPAAPVDPDHILLGTISLAYFEKCLEKQTDRIIEAIRGN